MIFRSLLHGGHQLGRVHQVGAVADQDEDLALGLGQADAQPGRDLVAHARVAEFEMTALAAGGIPELEQVSGRAARGGDDRVSLLGFAIEQADQLALAHAPRLRVAGRPRPASSRLQALAGFGDFGLVGRAGLARRPRAPPGEGPQAPRGRRRRSVAPLA